MGEAAIVRIAMVFLDGPYSQPHKRRNDRPESSFEQSFRLGAKNCF
jgi:hypothetical protein